MTLVKSRGMAKKRSLHPDVLQIWCKESSGLPYFVHAIEEDGQPREPSDVDISICQGMDAGHTHQGMMAWAADLARGAEQRFEDAEQDYLDKVTDRFGPGGDLRDRALFLTRSKLVIPVKQLATSGPRFGRIGRGKR